MYLCPVYIHIAYTVIAVAGKFDCMTSFSHSVFGLLNHQVPGAINLLAAKHDVLHDQSVFCTL